MTFCEILEFLEKIIEFLGIKKLKLVTNFAKNYLLVLTTSILIFGRFFVGFLGFGLNFDGNWIIGLEFFLPLFNSIFLALRFL